MTQARGQQSASGRREDDRTGWQPGPESVPVRLARVEIEASSLRHAVSSITGLVGDGQVHLVATVNVDQSLHVRDDPAVLAAFSRATHRYADGAPVVALARRKGGRLPGRVTGADLVPALCSEASRSGNRIAFLGGEPGVGEEAARRLTERYPGLQVVHVVSPPLGFERDEQVDAKVIADLRQARPDIVFVGLGSPKQELWVDQRRFVLPPAVYLGVGGSLDFAAGKTKRAPQLMQRMGMEWLYRLMHDWRRLWKRYLINDVRFLFVVASDLRARRVERSEDAAEQARQDQAPPHGHQSDTAA